MTFLFLDFVELGMLEAAAATSAAASAASLLAACWKTQHKRKAWRRAEEARGNKVGKPNKTFTEEE